VIPGSAGCQPAVVGSLPTTSLGELQRNFGCASLKSFSASCRKGQAGSLCSPEKKRATPKKFLRGIVDLR
jgi:hypothetical protein